MLCKQIKDSGKTPSMGLIKARSSQAIPIPTIIAALKQFKEMTDTEVEGLKDTASKPNSSVKNASGLSDIQRIEQLEHEVTILKTELKEMKSLLKASIQK
jgi:hypothetical protein